MGSIISCIPYIEEYVNSKIFCPPRRCREDYRNLNTHRSHLFYLFTKNNKKISAINIKPKYNSRPLRYFIFCNGNASDIINISHYAMHLSDVLNVGVIVYDYIGYGLSELESPTEDNCYNSMETIMEFVLDNLDFDPKNIFLVGYSLGTGVVIDYVSKHKWNTPIILISPYKSIACILSDTILLSYFDKFKTIEKLETVTCPVQIIHGINDKFIDTQHSAEIYKKLKNKFFIPSWIEAEHNDIFFKIPIIIFKSVISYSDEDDNFDIIDLS